MCIQSSINTSNKEKEEDGDDKSSDESGEESGDELSSEPDVCEYEKTMQANRKRNKRILDELMVRLLNFLINVTRTL